MTMSPSLPESGYLSQSDVVSAAQTVERIVGNAWAANTQGMFLYVTPAVLASLGVTLEDLNVGTGAGSFGWERAIHPNDYAEAAAAWRLCLLTGDHYDVEHRMLRADGRYGWARCSGQPLRNGDGQIIGWYGAVMDRETLHAERDHRTIPSDLRDGSAGGPSSLGIVHPDDRQAALHGVTHAFWTGIPSVAQLRLRAPDGEYRWAETILESPRYDADGVLRWQGATVEIESPTEAAAEQPVRALTDAPETEAEAERAISVIERLFGNAWAVDAGGKITYLTSYSKRNIKQTIDEVNAVVEAGETCWRPTAHPDDYDGLAAAWRHCLETGDNFFYEHRVKLVSGYAWNRSVAYPIRDSHGRITGWYGTSITTDVYKKQEEALRERERELSQLVDMVPSLLWRLNEKGDPVFFSKRAIAFFGFDVGLGSAENTSRLEDVVAAVVHPDDIAAMSAELQRCVVTGESFAWIYRLRRADGIYRWVSGRAEPLRDETGKILQWYGLSHDIDDQMHIEEALRERERALWQLVETLPAMIDCAAPDGEPIYRSQQLREFLGYDLEDLDGAGQSRLTGTLEMGVHPDDIAVVRQKYAHSLSTGDSYAHRHRLRRFDGEYRWVETRAAPMLDAEGKVAQWNVICLDIDGEMTVQNELRLAQDRLARASQAASLAELSASIAHEVNQPLAAVVANSHACQRWLASDPPNIDRAKRTVDRVIRDANSVAEVVSRIRALFKRSVEGRKLISLESVIAEVRELVADEAMRKRVHLNVDVAAGTPVVALDRVQLQQVLVNLVRNGMEAMEHVTEDRQLDIRVRRTEDVVETAISDRGPGVESIDRIFEPFFTTKNDGMGMGLAICRSIIESHGGRLWVERNEPQGSRFIFTLPLTVTVTAEP